MAIAKPSPVRALRALVAASSLAATGTLQAEPITALEAATALIAHTWHGQNNEGQAYWFYHEPDGRAVARFEPGFKGTQDFALTWRVEIDAICWDWNYGNTDCYHTFDLSEGELSMTRSDGVQHSGKLTEGKNDKL